MLTQDQIAYGQQKNREHIWEQSKTEIWEYKRKKAQVLGHELEEWSDIDECMTGVRYRDLCINANITPY